nr:hypothetical protein Iba_chr15bCG3840 [Ipomoea batatas]
MEDLGLVHLQKHARNLGCVLVLQLINEWVQILAKHLVNRNTVKFYLTRVRGGEVRLDYSLSSVAQIHACHLDAGLADPVGQLAQKSLALELLLAAFRGQAAAALEASSGAEKATNPDPLLIPL